MNLSRPSIDIPITIAEPSTGMSRAVLSELFEQLLALEETGQSHVIDLNSLPMSDSDKRDLKHLLGEGEVSITLSTIGDSQIFETAYSGIWWIKHFSPDEKLIAELIEITNIPEIIKSHPDDMKQAANALKKIIDDGESGEEV